MEAKLYRSESNDPAENLAWEEILLTQAEPVLLTYINRPAVIIGRHQNPYWECADSSLPIFRRISGGGAVYHDTGNLNYAFIVPRKEYKEDTYFALLIAVLENLGIEARKEGSFSIYAGKSKISGNAFCFRKHAVLHHGTILINSNLEELNRILTPEQVPDGARTVRSNPAPVINLKDLAGVNLATVRQTIEEHYQQLFTGAAPAALEAPLPSAFTGLVNHYRSDKWRIGTWTAAPSVL